jgi:hypothetical protein
MRKTLAHSAAARNLIEIKNGRDPPALNCARFLCDDVGQTLGRTTHGGRSCRRYS